MTKDGNNGRKGSQDNKNKDKGQGSTASKAILMLGWPSISKRTMSLRLVDALGNEVKEKLDNWRDGYDGRILVNMLVKSIEICNTCSLYTNDRQWQDVVQAISRALSGRCQRELNALLWEIKQLGNARSKQAQEARAESLWENIQKESVRRS